MKNIIGIFFLIFASSGECVVMNCIFGMDNWNFLGFVYTCVSQADNTGNLRLIEEVLGSHESEKSNSDVVVLREVSGQLQNIPLNLVDFFPNLKHIFFNAPLLKLSANDLYTIL
jgi:hypothetical protein